MLRIDKIVFGVSPYKSNVQDLEIVVCMHDKPVLVATYVENNSITFQETGMPIAGFNVFRTFPVGL